MRRLGFLLLVLGGVACSTRALPLPISILGLSDIRRIQAVTPDAGQDLLFMTSSDHDELRILNLDPNLIPRDFIRAPNPIEPLAIPVLSEPVALAYDVMWNSTGGTEIGGNYLFARSNADSEISVVTALPANLVEYCRLELSGNITAMAARAPTTDAFTRLYYATWDGATSHVFMALLPQPGILGQVRIPGGDHLNCLAAGSPLDGGAGTVGFTLTQITDIPGASIQAMAVLPPPPDPSLGANTTWPQQGLVIATREGMTGGSTFVLDEVLLTQKTLQFPSPVRDLRVVERMMDTSGDQLIAVGYADGGTFSVVEGSRILGVLDESACYNTASCNGVVSVDTGSGLVSFDGSFGRNGEYLQMLPLTVGSAIVTGVTIAQNGEVLVPAAGGALTLPLFCMVASSDGSVFMVNGETMQYINADTVPADVLRDSNGDPVIDLFFADGGAETVPLNTGPDPSSIDAGNCAAQAETVQLTYQGIIPAYYELPRPDAGGGNTVPLPAGGPPVLVGDIVEFLSTDPDCLPPTADQTAVTAASKTQVGFAAVPAACPNWTQFNIRANANAPFVVDGTTDGFMGRLAPGGPPLVFVGAEYCHNQPSLIPADGGAPIPTDGDQPAAALAFGMLPGTAAWNQGDYYTFQVLSNYAPEYLTVDPRVGAGFQLPGQVAFDVTLQTGYIAYPAADGVVEFSPADITHNQPNYLNLEPYR
jgi:hypothetical protein